METQIMSFHYHFHVLRHYFECHDILEDHWKDQTQFSKHDAIVSLICSLQHVTTIDVIIPKAL